MIEMINAWVNNFVDKVMGYGYSAVHFLLCTAVVVCGLILIVKFAVTWWQRSAVAGVCAALLIAAPYICRYALLPFFGALLKAATTVSAYIVALVAVPLLLIRWIWGWFTKNL